MLNVPCLEARSDFVGRNRWTGFSGLIARFHRSAFGRVLATPIRLLGDFDRTEEAAHDAFKVALEQWPQQGVPDNPRTWLISVGRFKAIDKLRRDARFDTLDDIPEQHEALIEFPADAPDEDLEDDQLRLILPVVITMEIDVYWQGTDCRLYADQGFVQNRGHRMESTISESGWRGEQYRNRSTTTV